MTGKLKFLLGSLAVIALLTVFRVGSSFYNNVNNSKTTNISAPTVKSSSTNALTADSDHDGLSDRDEILYGTNPYKPDTDGDGFIDGEEITTGHDPLDPSSDDKASLGSNASKNPNLTDRVANLTVASLINDSGQIDPANVDPATVNNIVQGIQVQAALSLFVEPIQNSDLSIGTDNSPEAIKKYLEAILPITEANILSPLRVNGTSGPIGLDSFFDDYKKAYQALKLIEVPPSWIIIHKDSLNLLQTITRASDALTDQAINEDPIKASYALQQIQNTFAKFHNILVSAVKLAKSQSISTDDPIFELLKN